MHEFTSDVKNDNWCGHIETISTKEMNSACIHVHVRKLVAL